MIRTLKKLHENSHHTTKISQVKKSHWH